MIFTGQQPAREIPAFVEACDILVSPRIRGTNTPLKIYSYLRSGRPIVATNLLTHTQVLTPASRFWSSRTPAPFAAAMIAADRARRDERAATRRRRLRAGRAGEDTSRVSYLAPHGARPYRGRLRSARRCSRCDCAASGVARDDEGAGDRCDRVYRRPPCEIWRPRISGAALVRQKSLERFHVRRRRARRRGRGAGDLTDRAAVRRAADGVDVIYHIAATYREAGQPDSAYTAINVDGTRHVLEAAKGAGVQRVVHCSTGGVHGDIETPPANEDAPFRPGDVYQETKLAGGSARARVRRSAKDWTWWWRGRLAFTDLATCAFSRCSGASPAVAFRSLAPARCSTTSPTSTTLWRDFACAAKNPAAAGRTYVLAGPRYTTLERAHRARGAGAGVKPPRLRLPVWPFWLRACVRDGVRAASRAAAALPPARRFLYEKPGLRHDARTHGAGIQPTSIRRRPSARRRGIGEGLL